MNRLIIIFLLAICNQVYGQHTISGKWRRVDETFKKSDLDDKKLRFGDMEIRSDSCFHIEGGSSLDTSTIAGWHVGDEYNGTWNKPDANHLNLK